MAMNNRPGLHGLGLNGQGLRLPDYYIAVPRAGLRYAEGNKCR